MRACKYCGDEVEATAEDITWCRWCHRIGMPLTDAFSAVLEVLQGATGTPWDAWNSGGGCFILATTLTDDEEGPRIWVSDHLDPLAWHDTPEKVEQRGGYALYAYVNDEATVCDDFTQGVTWREWGGYDRERGLSLEELPVAAMEAAQWLRSIQEEA